MDKIFLSSSSKERVLCCNVSFGRADTRRCHEERVPSMSSASVESDFDDDADIPSFFAHLLYFL